MEIRIKCRARVGDQEHVCGWNQGLERLPDMEQESGVGIKIKCVVSARVRNIGRYLANPVDMVYLPDHTLGYVFVSWQAFVQTFMHVLVSK